MNSHSEHIRKNIDELLRTTRYESIIEACRNKGILSPEMHAQIENQSDANQNEKHKEIFMLLATQEKFVYDEFVKILVELDFHEAARILRAQQFKTKPYFSKYDCYTNSKHQLVPFIKKINLPGPFEVVKSKLIQRHEVLQCYPMQSGNRGVCFIVNIMDVLHREDLKRLGSDNDSKYLLRLFQELGYKCFPYENLTINEFFNLLARLRRSEYLKQAESFVMVLMSHGKVVDMQERVLFHDGKFCKLTEIEDFMSNTQCKSLRGKPKVLIFPFCRGNSKDYGVDCVETDDFDDKPLKVDGKTGTLSDLIVCYGTTRGYASMRKTFTGSWFIQSFCKILAEHAHNMHFEDMLKLILADVKSMRTKNEALQTPSYSNHGFDKLLFFNPGITKE